MAQPARHASVRAPSALPSFLRQPWAWMQARWQRLWLSRLPVCDQLRLTHGNVYILPTAAGWMLALTLAVLLVGSINYQLNLGYLLTFLLAGSAVAGMHLAHGTLRGLGLALLPPEPCFAGQPAALRLTLLNSHRRTRHGVGLGLTRTRPLSWTDVPGGASVQLTLAVPGLQRGLHALPRVTVQTWFPMGTFRVWARWQPASRLLVYPRPEPHPPPLPPGDPLPDAAAQRAAWHPAQPEGLRPYRAGDPMQRVAWKASARNDLLISKDQPPQAQPRQLWLELGPGSSADLEQRLSRLCAWVLLAEAQALRYGLRLPGVQIDPGQGEAHRRRCLEALALC